jgi:phosphonate transport system permease protein
MKAAYPTTLQTPVRSDLREVLDEYRRQATGGRLAVLFVVLAVGWALTYGGAFSLARYQNSLTTLLTLIADALPPDFSRWQSWGKPLLETLAMSIGGTALGLAAAVPLGVLAARGVASHLVGRVSWLLLNTLRSVPDLVWGVLFVASVGFGPLPGIFALGCHSTGMLGKFIAEMLDHADRTPGEALRSHGVSSLGVLRFAMLPQILPRLVDVTIYRWEHNLRSATILGVIGAGGLGLEIITAFHLFEYREAFALILVLLGLVTVINAVSERLRGWFLDEKG